MDPVKAQYLAHLTNDTRKKAWKLVAANQEEYFKRTQTQDPAFDEIALTMAQAVIVDVLVMMEIPTKVIEQQFNSPARREQLSRAAQLIMAYMDIYQKEKS